MAFQNKRPNSRSHGGARRSSFPSSSRGSTVFSSSSSRPQSGGRNKRKKENIHISRFIKPAVAVIAGEEYVPKHTFNDFAIDDLIKRNIAAKGITIPSPIQDQTIPLSLTGRDVIGIANTGTGKTIAFGIPMLQRLLTNRNSRALVMAPTRELANQILDEYKTIAKGSGLFGTLLIGGMNMQPQLRDLRQGPEVVIGTPGRIKDHIQQGSLNLAHFDIVVLDEVDRMLDMGFVRDVRTILEHLASPRQSFFFSATMDERVGALIREFATDPTTVSVTTGVTTDTIEQDVVQYSGKDDKVAKLHQLLLSGAVSKALVFDDTKYSVERLSKQLAAAGFAADAIHGGKSQNQRQRALNQFKANDITILVATDVAARGIDVSDVTHVINYSTPQTYTDYVHRIGRAGRAGRKGYAITFVEQ